MKKMKMCGDVWVPKNHRYGAEHRAEDRMYAVVLVFHIHRDHSFSTYAQKEGEGLNRCAYAVRTGGGGGQGYCVRTATWLSNAEIDHLTQVNLCASPTSQEVQEGGGGLVARVRRAYRRGEGSKIPESFAYVLNEWSHIWASRITQSGFRQFFLS